MDNINNLMQRKFGVRKFPEILFDWNCEIDDIISHDYLSIGQILDEMGITIQLEQTQSEPEIGYLNYVIKVSDNTQTIFIRLDGVYSSYDPTFMNWHQVKPVEVTKIEYQRC